MATELDQMKALLTDVQSQLAFQEDAVRGLNDAMADQQQEIILLRRQLELLKQRIDEQATVGEQAAPSSLLDEKPPHY